MQIFKFRMLEVILVLEFCYETQLFDFYPLHAVTCPSPCLSSSFYRNRVPILE